MGWQHVSGRIFHPFFTSEELDGVVQNDVEERVVAFQYASGFTATAELDADEFVHVPRQVQNSLLLLILQVSRAGRCRTRWFLAFLRTSQQREKIVR